MLREVVNAALQSRLTLRGRRHRLMTGQGAVPGTWGARRHRVLRTLAPTEPVPVVADGRRTYWWFEDRVYWEDEGLDHRDVVALVRDRERRRRRALERAHGALAAEAEGGPLRRRAIPRAVRHAVFERDGGRCTGCGSDFDLQYDHVIPVALGGGDAADNLQLLCGDCNRRKGTALA